jgi:SWI/SNF-related matrix-associated actin-dependent regulator 1 of chromatin subfamily A
MPTKHTSLPKVRVVPEGLKLRRYQKEGVKRMVSQQRTLLADAPGLGKTVQFIVASNIWKNPRVVVIAPAGVLINLEREWKTWDILNRKVFRVKGAKSFKEYRGEQVIICSYGSQKVLFKDPEFLKTFLADASSTNPSLLVADEFHNCKNWASQRTHYLIERLLPQFHLFVGVTGTPLPNRVADLHPLVSACAPTLFPGFKAFCETYSNPVFNDYAVEYRGIKNVTKLRKKLRTFMIRRYKEDVLKELPEKIYIEHLIEVDSSLAKDSLKYVNYVQKMLGGEKIEDEDIPEKKALATCRKELGIAKISPVVEYCKILLEGGSNPLVIFGYHRLVVEGIEEQLKSAGYRAAKIYGGISSTNKQKIVDKFQAGDLDCVVCSPQDGITLTASNTVVFAELSYVPADMTQSMDRIHRIGQKNVCMIHFCLAEGSLDSRIWKTLLEKVKILNKAIGK